MSLVSGGCFGVIGVSLLVVLMIIVNESVKVATETVLGAGHFVLTIFSATTASHSTHTS
jgi:hypothetical protein